MLDIKDLSWLIRAIHFMAESALYAGVLSYLSMLDI